MGSRRHTSNLLVVAGDSHESNCILLLLSPMQSKCKLHGTPVMQSSEMLASILGATFGRAALARRGC